MSVFSIKDLEHLTGVKAHTIRIWEQRYDILTPKRTKTNIRFYDDQDLKLLLNVALLNKNGIKISRISNMSSGEMQREVIKLTETNFEYPEQIHALTISMVDLDEDRFEKIMSGSILKLGFEKTMLNIIFPFLTKIGILWQTGAINPAQEHFISNLVRQKLIIAVDNQFVPQNPNAKKFLLYLPAGELHELSLLFTDYLVKSKENKSIYLGQSVPHSDLKEVYEIYSPDFVVTVITSAPAQPEVQSYINRISSDFGKSQILVSGYQVVGQDLNLPENVTILENIERIIQYAGPKIDITS